MAGLLYRCALMLALFVHSTLQQQLTATAQVSSREGNTVHLTCMVTPDLQPNEGIDFQLDSTPVGEIAGLMIMIRANHDRIEVTIDPRHEGFFTCLVYDTTDMTTITTSDAIGPILGIIGLFRSGIVVMNKLYLATILNWELNVLDT